MYLICVFPNYITPLQHIARTESWLKTQMWHVFNPCVLHLYSPHCGTNGWKRKWCMFLICVFYTYIPPLRHITHTYPWLKTQMVHVLNLCVLYLYSPHCGTLPILTHGWKRKWCMFLICVFYTYIPPLRHITHTYPWLKTQMVHVLNLCVLYLYSPHCGTLPILTHGWKRKWCMFLNCLFYTYIPPIAAHYPYLPMVENANGACS